jgi:hypothetical protein
VTRIGKSAKTFPAIAAVDKILEIVIELEDEEIVEALRAISKAEATYGTLWGLEDPEKSGLDLDFYQLKGEVLEFLLKLRKHKNFHLAVVATTAKQQETKL